MLSKLRSQFPALNTKVDGEIPIFLDGPGGTQVPKSVVDAMGDYLAHYNSNLFNSPFFAVQKTHEVVRDARQKAAIFVNASEAEEIVFGPTMTALTSHFSRSISREWKPGDEIIVTALDHYSNVSFWQRVAEDEGVICHQIATTRGGELDMAHLEALLSEKTKLVAFTLASNVLGSYTDAAKIVQMVKRFGALTYVDSVHAAAHRLPDVQALDCDFLCCSAYKFCGPHLGFLYGKREHLERLRPYKVEPAPTAIPECWEMGTKSFEALAGFCAVIDYMALFHERASLRESLQAFYDFVQEYEASLAMAFLDYSQHIERLQLYGITDVARISDRTSTFAFNLEGHAPQLVSDHLAHHQIATGAGHFYAKGVVDTLGLAESGGFVRAGFVHYNTMEELERFFEVLRKLQ